jgi:hypothetical protein
MERAPVFQIRPPGRSQIAWRKSRQLWKKKKKIDRKKFGQEKRFGQKSHGENKKN